MDMFVARLPVEYTNDFNSNVILRSQSSNKLRNQGYWCRSTAYRYQFQFSRDHDENKLRIVTKSNRLPRNAAHFKHTLKR